MDAKTATDEWQDRTVQTWLLTLLRFALTLDNNDKFAALTIAAEIDKLSSQQGGHCEFKFFYRTSVEVCGAISNLQDTASAPILLRHLERTKNDRVKRAFAAALELDYFATKPNIKPIRSQSREYLWIGLRTKDN